MERTYSTKASSTAIYFVGKEVEKTPMEGKKTLFVVGLQNPTDIMEHAQTELCSHIYFGANQSFNVSNISAWETVIKQCLAENFWCTLDFDSQYIIDIHETGLCEYNNFIPQISVKVPHIKLLNYNAIMKIDDTDFDKSNPGVWCHRVHDLMDSTKFTNWSEYTNDVIIEEESNEKILMSSSHSITITSYESNGETIYQGSVAEYPDLIIEGADVIYVYNQLHREIALLDTLTDE
jgi:hypothetical protein